MSGNLAGRSQSAVSDDAQCTIALNYSLRIPFLPSKTLPLTATARMLVSQ